jgi:hypothetical protein
MFSAHCQPGLYKRPEPTCSESVGARNLPTLPGTRLGQREKRTRQAKSRHVKTDIFFVTPPIKSEDHPVRVECGRCV